MNRLLAALAVLAAFCMTPAQAAFPDKPIKLVVPYAPGGPADQLARLLGNDMGRTLGQPVVIENRPGAGTMIGARAVATAPADGYTLFLATNGSMVLTSLLYKKIAYDPADLTTLAIAAEAPFAVVVNPSVPVKTMSEFVSYVKQPGRVSNYASIGKGNLMQLSTELLKQEAGMPSLTEIPYAGSAEGATRAVISGDVQMNIDVASHAQPFILEGRVRALAVTSQSRLPTLPDVPTMAEAGFGGFEVATWYGLAIHTKTPPEIAQKLREAANKAISEPGIRKRLESQGLLPQSPRAPSELKALTDKERARWEPVIKAANIELN